MTRVRIRLLGIALLIALGLLVSVSAPTPARAATTPTPITTGLPRFEPGACVFPIAPDIDPQKVVCGKVVVAETHGKNDGRTIKLAVVVYKAVGPNPTSDVEFSTIGGPGNSSAFLTAVIQQSNPVNQDIIIYSQRGSDGSEPALICPQQQSNKAMRVSPILAQALADTSPIVTNALACRDYFLKKDVNLAAYTNKENTADINDIRAVLGYPKMNFLGVSATTELGLRLAADFPQLTRSIVLVSPTAPDNEWWLDDAPINYDYGLTQLYKTCAANASCKTITPDLKATFDKAFADLNANPLNVTFTDPQTKQPQTIKVNGTLFSNIIFQFLSTTTVIPFIPDIIAKTAKRDPAPLADIFTPPADPGPPFPFAEGVFYGNVCAHDFSAAIVARKTAQYKMLSPQAQALVPDLLDRIAVCQQWPTKGADPKADTPVSNAVPTLILQGDLDPQERLPYAEQVARQQSKSFLVFVPGGGHVPLGPGAIGECLGKIIDNSFLLNPTVKPDTSCISALKLTFAAYPLPQPAPSPTITPAAPAPTTIAPTPTAMPMPGLPDTGRGAPTTPSDANDNRLLLLAFLLAVPVLALLWVSGTKGRPRRS